METDSQMPTHYSCLLEFYSRSEIVLCRPKLKVRFHIGGHTELALVSYLVVRSAESCPGPELSVTSREVTSCSATSLVLAGKQQREVGILSS